MLWRVAVFTLFVHVFVSSGEALSQTTSDENTMVHGVSCILPDGRCNYNVYLNTNTGEQSKCLPDKSEGKNEQADDTETVSAAAKQLVDDVTNLKGDIEKMKAKSRAAEVSLAVNERMLTNFRQHLSQTVRQVTGGNAIRERKIEDLEKKVAALARESVEKMERENLRLMSRIFDSDEEIDSLKNELNTSRQDAEHFKSESERVQSELSNLQQRFDDTTKQLNEDISGKTENLKTCESNAAEMRKSLDTCDKQNIAHVAEITSSRVRLRDEKLQVETYRTEANVSETMLKTCQRDLDRSNGDTKRVQQNLNNCRHSARELRTRMDNFKNPFGEAVACPVNPISKITKVAHVSVRLQTQGFWGRDPLSTDTSYWIMDGYDSSRKLIKFSSLANLETNTGGEIYTLSEGCIGAQHNVYNNTLYCLSSAQPKVNAWDISKNPPVLRRRIPLVEDENPSRNETKVPGYKNICPYQWGGFSDVDVLVDEYGVYILYGVGAQQEHCRMRLKKIDTHTDHVIRTWYLNDFSKWVGNAFMTCGTLYVTDHPHRQPAFIKYSFDTRTGVKKHHTGRGPLIVYPNSYNYNAHLHYGASDKRLYAWENGHLVMYKLEF